MEKFRVENDIEAILQRLDRLTLDKVRATAAQTLEVVHSLVRHKRILMNANNTYLLSPGSEGHELPASIYGTLGMFHVSWR